MTCFDSSFTFYMIMRDAIRNVNPINIDSLLRPNVLKVQSISNNNDYF